MDLLPALDLRHGRAVRLRRGDAGSATVYDQEPARRLEAFAAAGARWVHVVDLDAAFGEPPQRELLAGLARQAAGLAQKSGPVLQVGGGMGGREAVEWALAAGFARVVVGSLLARDAGAFRRLAGDLPGRLVPALDLAAGRVRVAGWRETAERSAEELCAELIGLPCPALLVTDVARDGMLAGPNLELARRLARAAGLPALLSGGVSSLADLEAARRAPEIGGVIVGRALYEGAFGLAEALAVAAGEGTPDPRLHPGEDAPESRPRPGDDAPGRRPDPGDDAPGRRPDPGEDA